MFLVCVTDNKHGWSSLCQQQPKPKSIVNVPNYSEDKYGNCGLVSIFPAFFLFGYPLDSLHPLMLLPYQGHMPVSCQHACLLFRPSFCQTHPHCRPAQPSVSKNTQHNPACTLPLLFPLLLLIQDDSQATGSMHDQTGMQYIKVNALFLLLSVHFCPGLSLLNKHSRILLYFFVIKSYLLTDIK